MSPSKRRKGDTQVSQPAAAIHRERELAAGSQEGSHRGAPPPHWLAGDRGLGRRGVGTQSRPPAGLRYRAFLRELLGGLPPPRSAGELPACPSETILLQKPSFPMVSGLCAGETPALQRAEIHCGAVGTPADHSPASSLRRISSAIVSNSGSPRSESRSVSVSNPPHDQPVSRASWRLANASLRWPSMALMQARL